MPQFRWTAPIPTRHASAMAVPALLLPLLVGQPVAAATVAGIAVAADTVTLRFDDPVAGAHGASLGAPDRIALDVTGLEPGGALAPTGAAGGIVAGAKEMAGPDGATRLVLRLARPRALADGRFEDGGRRLVLSLAPVAGAASRASGLDFFPFSFGAHPRPLPRARAVVAIPPVVSRIPLPRVEGDPDRPLVVIDPGHGGFDPGAIAASAPGGVLREKDTTLAIARAIRDELLRSGRVRVALTRDSDRYLMLRERFGIARRLRADLFVSIHCDSTGTGDATGASVYTLSEVASDKEAARLAARENKADVIGGLNLADAGADVSSILIDLTQRETMNSSAEFARLLGREAQPLVPLKPNFHRMASLMVLKAPDMPSILFETGYLSNPRDAAFLDSDEGRRRIAQAVRRAVEVQFARRLAAR